MTVQVNQLPEYETDPELLQSDAVPCPQQLRDPVTSKLEDGDFQGPSTSVTVDFVSNK